MRRLAGVAVLCAALFLAPTATAYALWTAAASGAVTVSTAVPAPVLSCGPVSGNRATLTWTSIGTGSVLYTVYRRSGTAAPYTYEAAAAAGAGTSLQVKKADFSGNPTTLDVVVRATVGGVDSADSNARSISFSANTCS